MGGDWGLGFLSKNDDITSFQGSLKVLIGDIGTFVRLNLKQEIAVFEYTVYE